MGNSASLLLNFSQIGKGDVPLVGGKGASLGEMIGVGIPVPPGFVVTTETYKKYWNQELPVDVIEDLLSAFDRLGAERVAVRSSAVAEDSSAASWAGQLETYLNTTKEELIENIRKCWESIRSERALAYAAQQNVPEEKLLVAVVVQKMINSEASGVMFSVNPISKNTNEIMIEAGLGLGEMVVQGMITPDNFVVDKEKLEIKERFIELQDKMMIYKDGINQEIEVPSDQKDKQCIADEYVRDLAKLAIKIEDHYGFPCDIEWAKEGDKVYIIQSRPITTLKISTNQDSLNQKEKPVLIGLGASQGIKSGKVRLILDLKEIAQTEAGEILVAEKTTPDFIEAFGKVEAVITDSGGITSHAAIVSRELGIPAVVGTKTATKDLKNGDLVTVDGNSGKVYRGRLEVKTNQHVRNTVYKIEKSEDDLTDLVNSLVSVSIDSRELWPLAPGQLFAYIDFDQSYDFYIKLKSLIEDGYTPQKISHLFKHPISLKYFMLDSAASGLKVGTALKLAPITINDNVQMFKWMIGILKQLTIEDPFSMEGKNIIWSEQEINDFVKNNQWIQITDNSRLKAAINILSANLFTLCWSMYTDYFRGNGLEMHGAYALEEGKLGKAPKLLVRDFFDLKPEEIWPSAKKVPFKSLRLAQIYDGTEIFLNFGNTLVNNESITDHNTFFTLLIDGKPMLKEEDINNLSQEISKIAQEQAEYVNSLDDLDKVRKCAMLAYYGLKDFYLHFSDSWYPEDKVEGSIESIGRKPLLSIEKEDRDPETKRRLFDPRVEWKS